MCFKLASMEERWNIWYCSIHCDVIELVYLSVYAVTLRIQRAQIKKLNSADSDSPKLCCFSARRAEIY